MAESFPVKFNVFADVGDAIRGFEGLQRTIDTTAGVFRGLNKVLSVAENALGAMRKVMDFARMAADMRQLETAFNKTGASLGRLQEATEGQVSQMKLMEIANKSLRGENRLTHAELEMVLKAADRLSDQGFGPLVDIQEKLIDAMRRGTTKGLGELGIVVEDTGTKTGNMVAVLNELQQTLGDTAAEDLMAKKFDQFNTRVEDATNRLKGFLGEIALGFTIWLDEQLQRLGAMAGDEALPARQLAEQHVLQRELTKRGRRAARDQFQFAGSSRLVSMDEAKERILRDELVRAEIDKQEAAINAGLKSAEASRLIAKGADAAKIGIERSLRILNELNRKGGGGGGGGRFTLSAFEDVGAREIDLTAAGLTSAGGGTEAFVPGSRARGQGMEPGGDMLFGASDAGAGGRVAGGGRVQEIETTLQEMEERIRLFQSKLADSSTLVGATYQTTTTLVMTAMDAIIEGNGNWLRSFRKALAGQMKASALQNWARALEYGAMAMAGIPNMWGAAAKAAAAATAYTVGARLLGDGGGGAPSGAGGGASSGGGGFRPSGFGGQGSGQNITIIQVGDVFGKRGSDVGAMIDDALREARRTGKARDESISSVRFR